MSTETSELNQPNDGSESGQPRRRFGFLHADTGVDGDGVNTGDVNADATDDDGLGTDDIDAGTVYQRSDDLDAVDTDAADPQPTFTPTDGTPTDSTPTDSTPTDSEADTTVPGGGQVVAGEVVEEDVVTPDGEYETDTVVDTTPSTLDDTTVPASDAAPVGDAVPASAVPAPRAAAFDENAPLLGDSVTLRASWQQAAAEFVDDPRAAVAEAADLVEHTAQTLVGALQQRQRQLRGQWEDGTATGVNGSNAATDQAGNTVDTEELRHLMQSYRALFNQLCAL
jgi:hypothetical protein